MPTHKGRCRVCGKPAWCTDEAHALGSGRNGYCNGKPRSQAIEFCSPECFAELWCSMRERLSICHDVAPEIAAAVVEILTRRDALGPFVVEEAQRIGGHS